MPGVADVGFALRAVVSASADGSAVTEAASLPSTPVAPRSTASPAVTRTRRVPSTSPGWER